jgi:hypothetical protein
MAREHYPFVPAFPDPQPLRQRGESRGGRTCCSHRRRGRPPEQERRLFEIASAPGTS